MVSVNLDNYLNKFFAVRWKSSLFLKHINNTENRNIKIFSRNNMSITKYPFVSHFRETSSKFIQFQKRKQFTTGILLNILTSTI